MSGKTFVFIPLLVLGLLLLANVGIASGQTVMLDAYVNTNCSGNAAATLTFTSACQIQLISTSYSEVSCVNNIVTVSIFNDANCTSLQNSSTVAANQCHQGQNGESFQFICNTTPATTTTTTTSPSPSTSTSTTTATTVSTVSTAFANFTTSASHSSGALAVYPSSIMLIVAITAIVAVARAAIVQ